MKWEIKRVESPQDWECFFSLSSRDKGREASDRRICRFPFEFATAHWLLSDENDQGSRRVLGRVGANVSAGTPGRGYIGFFQISLEHLREKKDRDAATKILIETAEQWLGEREVETVFGPVDTSTWFNYRFLTEATPGSSFFEWEPVQPLEYVELWVNQGYEAVENYETKCTPSLELAIESTRKAYEQGLAQGFRVRPFRKTDLDTELTHIVRINQNSFAPQGITEPLGNRAYRELYVPLFLPYLGSDTFFVEDTSGREIAYCFAFVHDGHYVWKTLAVDRSVQSQGIGSMMLHHGFQQAKRLGLERQVSALIRLGGVSEKLTRERYEYIWSHRYSLFKKTLSN